MVKIKTHSKYLRGFSFNFVHFEPEIIKSKKLIILLPGAGYSYIGPLFYYPTQTMLQNGWVVLAVDYDFRNFKNSAELSVEEILSCCLRESLQFIQKYYSDFEVAFVAKSIGTQALCHLSQVANELSFDSNRCKIVWLTPLWNLDYCFQVMQNISNQSLYIIGDMDPHFSKAKLELIQKNQNSLTHVIDNADHSLNHIFSMDHTFQIHQEVNQTICQFLV